MVSPQDPLNDAHEDQPAHDDEERRRLGGPQHEDGGEEDRLRARNQPRGHGHPGDHAPGAGCGHGADPLLHRLHAVARPGGAAPRHHERAGPRGRRSAGLVGSPSPLIWRVGMRPEMTTTTFTLDGYQVVRSLGVVRGITVRSRSILGTIGGSLQTILGGNISLFTELCERTRSEAFDLMLVHADQLGANAVIGIRYEGSEVMQGVTEVLCYGT